MGVFVLPFRSVLSVALFFFFFNDTATTEIYTLSLHDALPICDFVDAIGITKGRGFEGVVGRHAFRGGDSTHGAKGWHRRSGAIGQRLFPGTVMRGMRMPGHMGQVRRTVQNLEVIQVREADNLLLIRGAIPGSKGDYVVIRESKKRPKGWSPHAERPENIKKSEAKKK